MATNISVNERNSNLDLNVKIFDRFYAYEAVVPANEYDLVFSFMRSIFSDNSSAANFTVTLFRVAQESKTPILTLLQELQGKNEIEVTVTLAYYINGLRSLTTLLGIRQAVIPYFYVARNVIV